MASINSLSTSQTFLSLRKPKSSLSWFPKSTAKIRSFSNPCIFTRTKQLKDSNFVVGSVAKELDVIPVQSSDYTDQQDGVVAGVVEMETEGVIGEDIVNQVVNGFGNEGRLSFEAASGYASSSGGGSGTSAEGQVGAEEMEKLLDRSINAAIVLAAGTFAITKLLTIDHDYWQGARGKEIIIEILRYAPQHNWSAYEEAFKANPVLAKMMISGVVYSLGDWIAQCYEGKPLFEFDRACMFRSGLVGFTLHGWLSHYYYQFCEALFPFDDWWVVPAKVAFDQTIWAAVWNSIYYAVVGVLRFDSPAGIFAELKATFWPMLTELTYQCKLCDTLGGPLKFLKHTVKRFDSAFVAVLIFLQLTCPVSLNGWASWSILPAEAVLYSPETKIPRTGELALRRAIPANTGMKAIQDSLEDISYLLRIPQRKPYGTMEGNVKKALKIAKDEKESILSSIPAEFREKGSVLYASLVDGKGGLQSLLGSIKDKDADKVSVDLASSLDTVAELELLQAPGLSFLLPQEYLKYPRLTGRGIVEFTIEKGDGTAFPPEAAGEPRSTATLRVVIDGYSAPLTAGNFAKLVMDGVYDGMKLNCANQAILSDGGLGNGTGYSIPLEIKPAGQFEPLYKTTLSVQDGELPVLPLSVYGAVAMAHSDVAEEYSSPNQFFFYLYDKRNAGLGGLSFDEGQFSVFGYTTGGREILSQIKTGDVIRTAKLVEGLDRLVLPKET